MDELKQLLWKLRADPRFPGFQGVVINMDLSMLVTYRWGSKFFESPDSLVQFLNNPPKAETVPA